MRESDYYARQGGVEAHTDRRQANAAGSGVGQVPFGAPPKVLCAATRKDGTKCWNSPSSWAPTCFGHTTGSARATK